MTQVKDVSGTVESLLDDDTPRPNKPATLAYRPNPVAPEVHLAKGDARDYVRAINRTNNRHPWAQTWASSPSMLVVIAALLFTSVLALTLGQGTESPLVWACAVAGCALAIVNKVVAQKCRRRNGEIARERLTELEAVMNDHAVPFTVDVRRLDILSPEAGKDVLRSAMDQVTPEKRDTMLSLIDQGDDASVQTLFDALLADAIEHKAKDEPDD